jgi:hypothetical protein
MYNLLCQKQTKVWQIIQRAVHRNHPGHKSRPPIIQRKYELPDTTVDKSDELYPLVKPEYPPGFWDKSYDSKLAWHYHNEGQKYHSLKTIQERLSVLAYLNVQKTIDEFNQIRHRFYPIYIASAAPKTPRMLKFNQYITKTHIKETDDLPGFEQADSNLYNHLKDKAQEIILKNVYYKDKYNVEEAIKIPPHRDS